jgi:single-stranded-DNA-specific exonuclease
MTAAGRMGNAEQALHLLLARDRGEGVACAESLEEDNLRRREFDERVAVEASERVRTELGWPDCSSILLWSETWHPGVLGIVASRLVERFHRPTVLVALEGNRGRGSGRSVSGLDLTRVLDGCSDLLDAYGGHAFAAGLTVNRERLPALRERIEQLVRERLAPDDCVSKLEIDADLTFRECDLELIRWLERAAPHGLDNPEPVFRTRDAIVESVRRVGGGRHVRLSVRDATGTCEAIGFGLGEQADGIAASRRCALAFTPELNDWMGETRIQLRLREVQGP